MKLRILSLRRIAALASLAVLTVALAALAITGTRMALHAKANRTIAALAAGRDLPVELNGPDRLLMARAHFLMIRDRLDEAQPLVERLAADRSPLAMAALYDLATAISFLEKTEIDPAVPQVRLAKAGYRAALVRAPDFWDAKYNLDIAMRLVRDFPQIEQDQQDEAQETPKRLWTDLPGLPKGLP
jgi:mxaK protein